MGGKGRDGPTAPCRRWSRPLVRSLSLLADDAWFWTRRHALKLLNYLMRDQTPRKARARPCPAKVADDAPATLRRPDVDQSTRSYPPPLPPLPQSIWTHLSEAVCAIQDRLPPPHSMEFLYSSVEALLAAGSAAGQGGAAAARVRLLNRLSALVDAGLRRRLTYLEEADAVAGAGGEEEKLAQAAASLWEDHAAAARTLADIFLAADRGGEPVGVSIEGSVGSASASRGTAGGSGSASASAAPGAARAAAAAARTADTLADDVPVGTVWQRCSALLRAALARDRAPLWARIEAAIGALARRLRASGFAASSHDDRRLLRSLCRLSAALGVYRGSVEPALLAVATDDHAQWAAAALAGLGGERDAALGVGGAAGCGGDAAAASLAYWASVEARLVDEDALASYCLEPSSRRPLVAAAEDALVRRAARSGAPVEAGETCPAAAALDAALDAAADRGAFEHLARLRRLLCRVGLRDDLTRLWTRAVETRVGAVIGGVPFADSNPSASSGPSALSASSRDRAADREVVPRLLSLRRLLVSALTVSFRDDEDLRRGYQEAFERALNAPTDARRGGGAGGGRRSGPGPAELVARFIDAQLRGGGKPGAGGGVAGPASSSGARSGAAGPSADPPPGASPATAGGPAAEADDEDPVPAALALFRSLRSKDTFEAHYRRDLSRRLLGGRSASEEAELRVLSALRDECGAGFTAALEARFSRRLSIYLSLALTLPCSLSLSLTLASLRPSLFYPPSHSDPPSSPTLHRPPPPPHRPSLSCRECSMTSSSPGISQRAPAPMEFSPPTCPFSPPKPGSTSTFVC